MRSVLARVVERYGRIDPRTLALTRVALAVLLLFDLGKRSAALRLWYTDDGLLPRHVVQNEFAAGASWFWELATADEVVLAFAGCALVYLALLVGLFTRIAQVLAIACVLSLQHRVQTVAAGGAIVQVLLCFWTVLLPLGRRFSVDAVLIDRLRTKRNAAPTDRRTPITSLAVTGLLLQLSAIYFFNAIQKDGKTWMDGAAIHFALWQEVHNTVLAVWVREWLPAWGSQIMTWGALVVEGTLPVLILSPWGRPWTARAAIALIVGLHVGIALLMNVGTFSASMITFSTVLVSTRDWDEIAGWLARRRSSQATASSDDSVEPSHTAASRAAAWAKGVGLVAREGLIAAFMYVNGVQLLTSNPAVPEALRPVPAPWHPAVAIELRLGQRWSMFAADVNVHDWTIRVDAKTVAGVRIDPYNDEAGRGVNPHHRTVPTRLGYDVYFAKHSRALAVRGDLQQALAAWLGNYHRYTGDPADRITDYAVLLVRRASPPLGERTPAPPLVRELMRTRL